MSQPSPPPDRSVELRQLELDAAERQRQAEAEAAAQRAEELRMLRTNSATAARGSANQYFASQGLLAEDYANPIEALIQQTLAGIDPDDPNPGAYFDNIGARVYEQEQTGLRNRSQRDLDRIFAPNFETRRIEGTIDDPYLESIRAEQFQSADEIIRNMLDRGVITPTGYDAAYADLESQNPLVNARLNEIGTGVISSGREGLRNISNDARQTAANLTLGTQFDPYGYSSDADRFFDEFSTNLGDTIRSRVPGDLFKTAGLAGIAGRAQGGQNTAFDPLALAGIVNPDEDEDQQSSGNTVF